MQDYKAFFKKICVVFCAALQVTSCLSANAASSQSRYETDSNRYVHYSLASGAGTSYEREDFESVLQNENIEVLLNRKLHSLRICDKRNGYIWGDLPSGDIEGLNNTWTEYARSVIAIEYYDAKLNEKRMGMSSKKTDASYNISGKSIEISVNFKELEISLKAKMSLTETGIRFTLNREDITEEGDAMLKSVSFLPFFGASRGDDREGYVLLPDGPGALMSFEAPIRYTAGYDKKIYGEDYGYDKITQASDLQTTRPNDFSVENTGIYLPVFGIVHSAGHNAFLASVNDGEEYGSISASPAGYKTDFNWATVRFNYRQKYNQPTGKDGGGVLMPNTEINSFDIDISYDFLNGEQADYSGMAVFYRDKLEKEKVLTQDTDASDSTPLHIEFLGSDIKKKLFFEYVNVFTSANQAADIIKDLSDDGIDNITAVYKGYFKGGLSKASLSSVKRERKAGSLADFEKLDKLVSKNGKFYYYVNAIKGTEKQVRLKRDVGVSISKGYISTSANNSQLMFGDFYYVKASLIPEYLKRYLNADIYSSDSFAIDYIGSLLFSDYTKNQYLSRTAALESIVSVLKNTEDAALYNANKYALSYSDVIFSVPTVSSQNLFFSDTVPFLQIVLSGKKELYSDYLNLGSNSEYTLLKLVEYGMFPSYLVTDSKSSELRDTPQELCFSTCYKDWKKQIKESYAFVSKALDEVRGAEIESHSAVADGVIRVSYGKKVIYINYNDYAYENGDIKVSPRSYAVAEV